MSARTDLATLRRIKEYPALTFYLRVFTDPSNHEHNTINKKRWLEYFDYLSERHQMSKNLSKRLKRQYESAVEVILERPAKPGAVIFLSSSYFGVRLADTAFEQQVYIDDHFYVEPLEAALKSKPAAMLLTLSQHGASLYKVTDSDFEKISLPDIEKSMSDVLRLDELSPSIQTNNSRRKGSLHGNGGLKDQRQKLLKAYVKHIDKSIKPELKRRSLPLILFGAKSIVPMYKNSTSYENVTEEIIFGSPTKLRDSEIHSKVKPLVTQLVTA